MADNGGMFGRVPSVQTKVSEDSETKITIDKFLWFVAIVFVGAWIFYALINVTFAKTDMNVFVTIAMVVMSLVIFPKADALAGRWIPEKAIVLEDAFNGRVRQFFISRKVIVFVVMAAITYALANSSVGYIVWIIQFDGSLPINNTLEKLLAYGIVSISVSFALPSLALFKRLWYEIRDPYHSPIEVAKIKAEAEERRKDMRLKRRWEQEDAVPVESEPEEYTVSIKNGNQMLRHQTLTKEEVEIVQFLEGVRDGKWTTSESTWNGQRLSTGVELSSVGGRIRDELLGAGWAEWRHPDEKRQGWILTDTPDEVIRGLVE